MTGLFIKDIRLLWQQIKIILFILFLSVILTLEMDSSYAIAYLTFVSAFLAFASPSFDEADNGYAFLFTLPIKRNTYVLEKYLFGILMVGVSCLTGSLISLVFYMARGQLNGCMEEMMQAWLIFPLTLVFISFVYPVLFKYGADKGRIFMAGIVGCVTALGYICFRLEVYAEIDIRPVIEWSKGHSVLVLALALAGVLLMFVASGFISARIMNKKEY